MWRFVLEVALAISVGVNIYLLTRHAEPAATPAPVTVTQPRPCPPAPDAGVVAVVAPIDASAPPECRPAVTADCSAVEKKLEETEAKLEEHLPPGERYKHAARSVENEARARAVLDPVFARLTKAPHVYEVECHGAVCKLDVTDASVSVEAWMSAVQQNGGFEGWAFGRETYAMLGPAGDTARSVLMGELGRALGADAGLAACAGGAKPSGSLTLQIALDVATQRLIVTTSGSLASEQVGQCVKAKVQSALDAIKVPSDLGSFAQELPLLR